MKKLQIIMPILLLTAIGKLIGQDTLIYIQANASMFSNTYTFIKKVNSDNFGRFKQFSKTDDMQYWYGEGTFIEENRKIILSYDTSRHQNRIETSFEVEHSDTIYIKWFDWWGEPLKWVNVRYSDTTVNDTIFQSDWKSGLIKIATKDIQHNKLSLFAYTSNRKIVDFEINTDINEVSIFANDTITIHTFDKTNETLKKNKKGFVTVGMWTNNKKTKFVTK